MYMQRAGARAFAFDLARPATATHRHLAHSPLATCTYVVANVAPGETIQVALYNLQSPLATWRPLISDSAEL